MRRSGLLRIPRPVRCERLRVTGRHRRHPEALLVGLPGEEERQVAVLDRAEGHDRHGRARSQPGRAEALGQVRQPQHPVTGVLGEQVVDVLQHRRPLLLGEDGAVAAGEDELAQRLAVDLLDVAEGGMLDGPEQAARVDRLDRLPRRRRSAPPSRRSARSTHGSLSSRTFQTSAMRPPGRSTRAISTSAGPWSNQWNACATVTTSALSAGSGIASAPPSRPSPRAPPRGADRASRGAARPPSPGDRGRRATASACPCRRRDRRRRTARRL